MYLYTSNESQQDVLFDNLGALDITGPVREETRYNYDGSSLTWVEQDLYGSSRVGIWNWKRALPSRTMVAQSETDTLSDWYMLGTRSYELTNHLENVLGVIYNPRQCLCCKKDTMRTILQFNRRAVPVDGKGMAEKIWECVS